MYDVVQIMGGISLISFLMFVRSQYLRVEQVTCLYLYKRLHNPCNKSFSWFIFVLLRIKIK